VDKTENIFYQESVLAVLARSIYIQIWLKCFFCSCSSLAPTSQRCLIYLNWYSHTVTRVFMFVFIYAFCRCWFNYERLGHLIFHAPVDKWWYRGLADKQKHAPKINETVRLLSNLVIHAAGLLQNQLQCDNLARVYTSELCSRSAAENKLTRKKHLTIPQYSAEHILHVAYFSYWM